MSLGGTEGNMNDEHDPSFMVGTGSGSRSLYFFMVDGNSELGEYGEAIATP